MLQGEMIGMERSVKDAIKRTNDLSIYILETFRQQDWIE